jgi:flagellar biosynthetic protein FliP
MRYSPAKRSFARAALAAVFALLAACAMPIDGRAQSGSQAPEARGAESKARSSSAARDDRAGNTGDARGDDAAVQPNRPAGLEASSPLHLLGRREDTIRNVQTVALFGLISLAPIALLMVTAFVRINIVLMLLRQALGSPQVPGNQVLTALALLLTALVMRPHAERVYQDAIRPYAAGELSAAQAWASGSKPIKAFMVDQIIATKHQEYLESLYDYAVPQSPGRADSGQMRPEDLPLHVVAPAYLLSELTTALLMGFYIYLPFLVIDLVVSSVLAATGLFMLPPSLVATPVKLIVFVLADGWLLIATMLLSSFGPAGL